MVNFFRARLFAVDSVGLKVRLSSGSYETVSALRVPAVGLLSEISPGADQLLTTVEHPMSADLGLLFDGPGARVTWGSVVKTVPKASNDCRLVEGRVWSFDSRLEALELYKFLAASLVRNFTGGPFVASCRTNQKEYATDAMPRKNFVLTIVTVVFSVVIAALILAMVYASGIEDGENALKASSSSQTTQNTGAVLDAGAGAASKPSPLSQGVPDDARASAEELALIAALPGKIPMRTSGEPVYVFSDPNCSYCRDLEESLRLLDSRYNPIMIPLGFRAGSMELSSSSLCVPQRRRSEVWTAMMAGSVSSAEKAQCPEGGAMVAQNQMLFGQLRLSATPTIVTPSGIFLSGLFDPEQLARVIGR